jgi:peptide/nickel transport system substrate-binding protein
MNHHRFVTAAVFALALASAPAEAAEPRGDLTIAWASFDQGFDAVEMKMFGSFLNFSYLYDGLVNLGPEGKGPGLAIEWKVAPNGLAIDFTLRPNVRFHNGDPFTAEDVKFSFERILSPQSAHVYRKGFHEALERVEVLGSHRVRFHLKAPWPAFFSTSRYALQPVLPKAYYERVGAKGFEQKPVGTGPFKLADLKPGEWTRFEANAAYWGQVSDVKTVTQRLVAEPLTRYAMLARGEADIISGVAGPLVKQVQDNRTLRLVYSRYVGTSFLNFNRRTNPEFKDSRVRLAVAHAIDREGIAQAILGGTCEVASQHFTPVTFGHDPALKPLPYDPARARALLREAGLREGHELGFAMHTQSFPSLPNTPQVLEAIAGNLEAVGFRLRRQPLETGAILSAWRAHSLAGIFYGVSANPDDGGALMDSWFVSWGPYSNEIKEAAYDEAFKRQLTEPNESRRRAVLQEWARTEAERVEAVPLFWCHNPFAVGPRVKDWKPAPGSANHLGLNHLKLAR